MTVGYNLPAVQQLCVLSADALDINRMGQVEHLPSVVQMTEQQARAFYERNHVTDGMATLLRGALKRLHGGGGQGIYELRQAMGGGKTHNMIMLGLLSRFPALAGMLPDNIVEDLDLSPVRVAVFNGRSPKHYMWGDIALQLPNGERFGDKWQHGPKAMTEGDWESLIGNEPTLIMLDELPPYLAFAHAQQEGAGTLLNLLTYSLSNLLSAAMKLPRCVVVIGSLDAAYNEAGDALSEMYAAAVSDLKKEAERGAKSITPVDLNTGEIYDILRKRLFANLPDRGGEDVGRVIDAYASAFDEAVKGKSIAKSSEQLADEIHESYPFHPGYKDILALFKENPKFRQTRGLIEFTSNLLRAVWKNQAGETFLIGAQHLDFADTATRDQMKDIEKSLEGALARDVYDRDGSAHAQIIDARTDGSAAREVATLVFVTSLSDNVDGIRGLRPETVFEYLIAPGRDPIAFKQAFDELRQECWYLHTRDGERFYFSDVANVRKQIEDKIKKVQQDQVDEVLRKRLSDYFAPNRKVAYQDLVILPRADDIQLSMTRRTCFVLSPDAKDPPQTATTIFNDQIYKNMFCVVSSDGSKMASAEDVVRRIIAITFVRNTVTEERHVKELAGELSTAERDFISEVKGLFNTVWYPAEKGLRSTKLEFEGTPTGIAGEAAVEAALEGKKLNDVGPDSMKKLIAQAEDRLFRDEKRMTWQKAQERAANDPRWPWLPPKGLDAVKAEAIRQERWTEDNGQVDIDPAPPQPTLKVGDARWMDAKGVFEIELLASNVGKNHRIVTADNRDGLDAGTVVDRQHETQDVERWYRIEDLDSGQKSDPILWQGELKLTYEPVARGDEWEVTFCVKPDAEIRWNTTGANPKEGKVYDGQPIRIPASKPVTLYVYAHKGDVSETKTWPLEALGATQVGEIVQQVAPEGRVRLGKQIVLGSKGQVLRAMQALRSEEGVIFNDALITIGNGNARIGVRASNAPLAPGAVQDVIDAIVKASGNPDAEIDLRIGSSVYPDYHMMKGFLDAMDLPFTMKDVQKEG